MAGPGLPGGQKQFLVTWEIDVWADDARDAAERARAAQVRPHTSATVFWVADKTKDELVKVDLLDDPETEAVKV